MQVIDDIDFRPTLDFNNGLIYYRQYDILFLKFKHLNNHYVYEYKKTDKSFYFYISDNLIFSKSSSSRKKLNAQEIFSLMDDEARKDFLYYMPSFE